MSLSKSLPVPTNSVPTSAIGTARHYFGGQRGLIALAAAALILGGILGWGWLVAIGVAPFLLGLLPCAADPSAGESMEGSPSF